nr:rRNA 2'-O-methyltransferase fibrillarin-like [Aegilops tauschii subsp. strangulata]
MVRRGRGSRGSGSDGIWPGDGRGRRGGATPELGGGTRRRGAVATSGGGGAWRRGGGSRAALGAARCGRDDARGRATGGGVEGARGGGNRRGEEAAAWGSPAGDSGELDEEAAEQGLRRARALSGEAGAGKGPDGLGGLAPGLGRPRRRWRRERRRGADVARCHWLGAAAG